MSTLFLVASIGLLAGCAALTAGSGTTATADLHDARGASVGTARFQEVSDGVHVVLHMTNMPPGAHGVHIHAVGQCDPPAFTSAGAHFDPAGKRHGTLNPQGPHAGDLPNIMVEANGRGRMETVTDRITLGTGPASILDTDGSALVVHAGPDDFTTDPSGGSGARIACGVVRIQEPPRPEPVRGY